MTRCAVAAAVFLGVAVAFAQPPSRLKGRVVMTADGPPNGADIRIEALYGFRGEGYAGQSRYSVRTDGKGEWALIGFKAGAWAFEAWASGQLPDVIVLPINVGAAQSSGVAGDMPLWHPVLRPMPVPQTPSGELLREAADAARTGRTQAMVAALARLAESGDAAVLIAAGRLCLVAREAASARPFFRRAQQIDAKLFGASIGMASSALMQQDWDTAATEFAEARKLTTDKDERGYLSAAVADLNKLHITWKRTGP